MKITMHALRATACLPPGNLEESKKDPKLPPSGPLPQPGSARLFPAGMLSSSRECHGAVHLNVASISWLGNLEFREVTEAKPSSSR